MATACRQSCSAFWCSKRSRVGAPPPHQARGRAHPREIEKNVSLESAGGRFSGLPPMRAKTRDRVGRALDAVRIRSRACPVRLSEGSTSRERPFSLRVATAVQHNTRSLDAPRYVASSIPRRAVPDGGRRVNVDNARRTLDEAARCGESRHDAIGGDEGCDVTRIRLPVVAPSRTDRCRGTFRRSAPRALGHRSGRSCG